MLTVCQSVVGFFVGFFTYCVIIGFNYISQWHNLDICSRGGKPNSMVFLFQEAGNWKGDSLSEHIFVFLFVFFFSNESC